MKNQQQEVTFVFGNSVKGFLKRYEADAMFAQEARQKAAGVLDGSIRLTCPDGIRPTALKLLRRLKNSKVELFAFYTSAGKNVTRRVRDQMIQKEFVERLRNHTGLAKFVYREVAPAAAAGHLDLRCKKEHRRIVRELLVKAWGEQCADHNGWHVFTRAQHPLTGERELTKVRRLPHGDFTPNSGSELQERKLLGFTSKITWDEAAKLDAKDPTHRVQLHGATAPSFENQRALREDRSDDILDNPNFGDYEDKERRDQTRELADRKVWLASKALAVEVDGSVADFVPPMASQKEGRGGSAGYWAKELGRSVRVQKAQRTPGPRWPTKAPSDKWLEERKNARKVSEEEATHRALLDTNGAEVKEHEETDVPETTVRKGRSNVEMEALRKAAAARRKLLDADEAEGRRYAVIDAPETDLDFLERDAEKVRGKASKGLIGDLAKERVAAQKRDELYRRHVFGHAALKSAVGQV